MSIEDPLPGWNDAVAAGPSPMAEYDLVEDEETGRKAIHEAGADGEGRWMSADAAIDLEEVR